MEIVSPVIDIISRVWSCSAVHGNYLCELKENVSSLKISLTKLKERRDDVKEKVEITEENPTEPVKRTHEVSGWLGRVESLEQEVESILQTEEAPNNEKGSYYCCWGRKNCCSGYKLGKSVVEKLSAVEKLWEEGNFNSVVEKSQPEPVREIIENQVVGMQSKLEEVWSLLVDETSLVRIVGLYGMGGVGKTTLLKKLNNEFLKRNHHFDKVIWVVVSKDLDIKNIQKQIGKSLGLTWADHASIDEQAKDITRALKSKKFVLFLDDIWERVELATIGIPILKSNSSRSVCGFMEADKKIKIDCLQWDEAWSLFQKSRTTSFKLPSKSSRASQTSRKRMSWSSLALITIGRTMATKSTLQQWQHAINVLRKSASEFSAILKFSYDNLENEKLKSCFLYCSLLIPTQNKLKLHEWENAEELNGAPNCSNLSTLLLNQSIVRTISDDFFQSMPILKKLPTSINSLTELRYFDLSFRFQTSNQSNYSGVGNLTDLNYLGIRLETDLAFQRLVSSHKLQLCTRLLRISKCGHHSLVVSPPSLASPPVSSSLISLANMVSLKSFLDRMNELHELRIEDNLQIVWDVPQRSTTTFCFMNLKDVKILSCLITSDGFEAEEKLTNTFSRLRRFRLYYLPKLKRICNHDVKFLSLEHIHVRQCGKLKKLPFGTNSVISNTLQSIEGPRGWWEGLEWEDETTKSNIAPYFSVNNG
ncbi:hypothetical protein MKW92_002949 [Papaver armeniacum]|nr:hypothetical protein MKW92_002949 [Papaver armeniacum]